MERTWTVESGQSSGMHLPPTDHPGFFTRAEARDAGHDDKAIAAAVRSGDWIRFRRNYYSTAADWLALDEVGRHLVRSRAVLHSMGPAVVLSHVSASVAHGVDAWGIPLDRVHVTRLDGGAGRVEADVVHHVGRRLGEHEPVVVAGLRTVPPVRASIEAVGRVGPEVALCHFNGLLRAGLAHEDELREQFEVMAHWPFTQHLHIPIRLIDQRSESVGEDRGAWFFYRNGIPKPVSQFEIRNGSGEVVATCDWGWPQHGVVGEFDGKLKYGRLVRPGQQPGDVMFAEKQREDLVRELTGMRMIRLVWSDYDRQHVTAQRLRRALRLTG